VSTGDGFGKFVFHISGPCHQDCWPTGLCRLKALAVKLSRQSSLGCMLALSGLVLVGAEVVKRMNFFTVDVCQCKILCSCCECIKRHCMCVCDCEQMPFVSKQPAYNILYELIVRTITAVKELDSLQAERFQRKIRFARQEANGDADNGAIASAPPEEISTGDESAVCFDDMTVEFMFGWKVVVSGDIDPCSFISQQFIFFIWKTNEDGHFADVLCAYCNYMCAIYGWTAISFYAVLWSSVCTCEVILFTLWHCV